MAAHSRIPGNRHQIQKYLRKASTSWVHPANFPIWFFRQHELPGSDKNAYCSLISINHSPTEFHYMLWTLAYEGKALKTRVLLFCITCVVHIFAQNPNHVRSFSIRFDYEQDVCASTIKYIFHISSLTVQWLTHLREIGRLKLLTLLWFSGFHLFFFAKWLAFEAEAAWLWIFWQIN